MSPEWDTSLTKGLIFRFPRKLNIKIEEKSHISFCKISKNKWYHAKETAEEVSFEWSHHRI